MVKFSYFFALLLVLQSGDEWNEICTGRRQRCDSTKLLKRLNKEVKGHLLLFQFISFSKITAAIYCNLMEKWRNVDSYLENNLRVWKSIYLERAKNSDRVSMLQFLQKMSKSLKPHPGQQYPAICTVNLKSTSLKWSTAGQKRNIKGYYSYY